MRGPDFRNIDWAALGRRAQDFARQMGAFARRIRLGRTALYIGGGVVGVGLLGAAGLYALAFGTTPDLPLNTDLYALNRPPAYIFEDEDGKVVGQRGAIVGQRLKLTDMPAYLPAAFIAMEDRRFYSHDGIDPRGMARALIEDIEAGQIVAGGSTITQQLAKILFLTPDRTFERKIKELGNARGLEQKLSKNQILELYLNRIYLGSGTYGVDGAAQVYFGKSARDVTLAEAAMLASLTRAPTAFSPHRDLPAAQTRASTVLRAMVETGAITEAQADKARAKPAKVVDRTLLTNRNYFFDVALTEAKSKVNVVAGDLVIRTTIDAKMQDAASKSLTSVMDARGDKAKATQAALVAMTPDGAVRALIGGRDYADSTFNRAVQAHRQPGSAFKPFVYLTALETGLTPWTVRNDEPITIGKWSPDNYGETYRGPVTLRTALADSINTVAAELGNEVGPASVVATARRIGISSPLQANASLALGTSEVTPYELTAAYGAFASQGLRTDPYIVLSVTTGDGRKLYERKEAARKRVIDQTEARTMNAMLADVVLTGTGTGAALANWESAGKTGTSQEWRDAWFVGFTANLVAGVWVGNDDSSPMQRVTGGAIPARIWKGFMTAALKGQTPQPLPQTMPPPPDEELYTSSNDGSYYSTAYPANEGDGSVEYHDDGSAAVDGPPRPSSRGNESTVFDSLLGWLTGSRSGPAPEEDGYSERSYGRGTDGRWRGRP
jgi:penicillin-binding protein 1A